MNTTIKNREALRSWGASSISRLKGSFTYSGLAAPLLLIALAVIILWQFGFSNIFSTTTTTGGDTSAHIWAPEYLKNSLFPGLFGWTQDWFGGLPAFTFYMVVPNLFASLLSYIINANVAFKLVSIGGVILLPFSAYFFGKMAGLKKAIPEVMAVFSLFFLYDDNFVILGGNVLSTLAGEFAESWGLAFALLYLGFLLKGIREGRVQVWAAIFLALAVTSHPLAGLFAAMGTAAVFILEVFKKNSFLKNARVGTLMFILGSGLSAFWAVPFLLRSEYTTSIGWVKSGTYAAHIFRGDWWWLFMLAVAGLALSIIFRLKLGRALGIMAVGWALAYRFIENGHFFVDRFLPFYYLCILFLAAICVGQIIRTLLLLNALKQDILPRTLQNFRIFLIGYLILLNVLTLFRYVFTGFGTSIFRWVLSNNDVLAERFFFQFVEVLWWGAAGLALASFILYLPTLVGYTKNWFKGFLSRNLSGDLSALPDKNIRDKNISSGAKRSRLFFMLIAITAITAITSVGLQLRFLGWEDDGRFGVNVPVLDSVLTTTTPASLAPAWADWNYSGYEEKTPNSFGPGWEEYSGIMRTAGLIGGEWGCGRALWEYQNDRMTSYGSSFSRNLFAYWTGGCVTAIDGLYTESSATSPFYYISLSAVSTETSEIIRGRQYVRRNSTNPAESLDEGVEFMKLLGVRYYIVSSPQFVAAANEHPDLLLLASFPADEAAVQRLSDEWGYAPHNFYLVKGSDTVVPLQNEPAVIGESDWLDRNNQWWLDPQVRDVFLVSNGPEEYQRLDYRGDSAAPVVQPERRELSDVAVSNVVIGDQEIRFNVDRTGVPILIKVSYYPNWQVSGARGPYRASPNWMVVIPTDNEVVLTYRWTPIEYLGYGVSGLAIIVLTGVYIWERRRRSYS